MTRLPGFPIWIALSLSLAALAARPRAAEATTTQSIAVGATSKQASWGGDAFASGYNNSSYVRATQATDGNTTSRAVNMNAWGRVLGNDFSIASLALGADTNTSRDVPTFNYSVTLGPFVIDSKQPQQVLSGTLMFADTHPKIATYTQLFWAGPVPINVTIDVYGRAQVAVSGNLDKFGGDASFAVLGGADTQISVGVGIKYVAAFGVDGYLFLVRSTPEVDGSARWSYTRGCSSASDTDKLTGWMSLDHYESTLDGSLDLWADFALQHFELPIFTWSGTSSFTSTPIRATTTWPFPAVAPAPAGYTTVLPGMTAVASACPNPVTVVRAVVR